MCLLIQNWECEYTSYYPEPRFNAGRLIGVKSCYKIWQVKLQCSMNEHNVVTFKAYYDKIY